MICPECSSPSVSLEVGPTGIGRLSTQVVRAQQGGSIEVVRACWICGWRETRTILVDSIHVEAGDEEVATRERLLDELYDLAAALDTAELTETVHSISETSDEDEHPPNRR